MKNLRIILLLVVIATSVFSCKKGENDPSISLHSRKARVVGEWTLKSGSITYNGTTTTYPLANYTETIEFKGDHTYTRTTVNNSNTSVEEGSWAFCGKAKDVDLKKREALILFCTSYKSGSTTDTYTGSFALSGPNVWLIDKLANKEMVIKKDGTSSSDGNTSTLTGTLTYEQ
jgi:hypothetical protein